MVKTENAVTEKTLCSSSLPPTSCRVPKKGASEGPATRRDGRASLKLKKMKNKNKSDWRAEMRRCVDRAIKKHIRPLIHEIRLMTRLAEQSRSSSNQSEPSSATRTYQLRFDCELPKQTYSSSYKRSKGVQGSLPVKITLLDEFNNLVEEGPLSSIKVKVVALGADFTVDDTDDWTKEEFNSKIVDKTSNGKSFLAGTVDVTLRGGVGFTDDLYFTENSSFLLNKTVRVGVKVADSVLPVGARVREAVSGVIRVKDIRGISNEKPMVPDLDDHVQRLVKIGKKYSDKLGSHGINKVKDFLQFYYSNQSSLRNILGVPDATWESITQHAMSCKRNSDPEHYIYKHLSAETNISLLFDCVYDLVGVSVDHEKYHSLKALDCAQKNQVEICRRQALVKLHELVKIDFPPDVSNEPISRPTTITVPEDAVVPSSNIEGVYAAQAAGNSSSSSSVCSSLTCPPNPSSLERCTYPQQQPSGLVATSGFNSVIIPRSDRIKSPWVLPLNVVRLVKALRKSARFVEEDIVWPVSPLNWSQEDYALLLEYYPQCDFFSA